MARSTVPPWIKNLTRLLSDEAYLGLTPNRRALLHGLWLEYARTRRQLPGNTASLSRRLAMKVTSRDLEALNHAGFLTFSASKPAGKHASLEVEVEVEEKDQLLTPPPKPAVSKPSKERKPRAPDPVWDFVVEIEGEPLPRYRVARGRIVADLHALLADTTSERWDAEMRRRHGALAREWGDSKATARALVQHWHRAGTIAAPARNGHTAKGGFDAAKSWVATVGWQYPEADLVEDLAKKFVLRDDERAKLRELAFNLQKGAS